MREHWTKNHDLREEKWHFLKIASRYCLFELRFEIRNLKLALKPNFSLIHPKQRNNDDFPLLKLPRHQNEDYDVILWN